MSKRGGGGDGGVASKSTRVIIPLTALPVLPDTANCEAWLEPRPRFGDIQQKVFLLNATFRCIRAAIELANGETPAYLVDDPSRVVYQPELDHCRGDLRIKERVLRETAFVPNADAMDANQIQAACMKSWAAFSRGLRPLWNRFKLGKQFDLVDTMVKKSTTLPTGYTLVHQMNFTPWTKSDVDFDAKWTGKFAMWWTPLLDAMDVGRSLVKTDDATMLPIDEANYAAMTKRPICGFLNIDAFEKSGGREKKVGTTRRTGFFELVTDFLNPICELTEARESGATFEANGLLGLPMQDAYVNRESCWNVVQTVQNQAGLGRDRTLPMLLEQAFSGWVYLYDPKSSLERQVVLFPSVRAPNLFHTWEIGNRPGGVNVSAALQIHVAEPLAYRSGKGRLFVKNIAYDQGVTALNATVGELKTFLQQDVQASTLPDVHRANLKRAARTGDIGSFVHLLEGGLDGFEVDGSDFTGIPPRANAADYLLLGAENGHLEIVDFLLDHYSATITPEGFSSALAKAAQKGHDKVVGTLLQDGRADPTVNDSVALREAARNGHSEVVKLLLEDLRKPSADPEANSSEALRTAATNGHTEVVRLLLKDRRADPELLQSRSLRVAANNGRADVVKLLLEDGRADPSALDSKALQLAATHGHTEVVRLLLADPTKRADPTFKNSEALRIAAGNGYADVVGLLLEDGRADPSALDSEALRTAAANGYDEVVGRLLGNGRADPTALDSRALRDAAKNGHAKVVGRLLEDEPAEREALAEALVDAAKYGHTEVVRLLLEDQEKRADPEFRDSEALRHAAANGHTDIVELLLEDGRAEPRAFNSEALYMAAANGHTFTVKLLLKDGRAVPTDRDSEGLENAAKNGHTDVVRLLLEDGRADPTDRDSLALRNAARNGHSEVVELLLNDLRDPRADPTALDSEALRLAAANGHSEVVGLLLRDLRDPRAQPTALDSVALRIAAANGHTSTVRLLLEDGRADPSALDSEALREAAKGGHSEVVELLLNDPRLPRADPTARNNEAFAEAVLTRGHVEVGEVLLRDPRLKAAVEAVFRRLGDGT